jgi:hypothetical protein
VQLRDVNLAHCHRLTDATLSLLGQHQPLLQHLDCSCWTLLTDTGLASATGRFPHLRSLALGHCRQLTTPAVLRCVLRCPRLSELRLPHCALVDARLLAAGVEPPHRRALARKQAAKRREQAQRRQREQQFASGSGATFRPASASDSGAAAAADDDEDDEDDEEDGRGAHHPVSGARRTQPAWYPGDISSGSSAGPGSAATGTDAKRGASGGRGGQPGKRLSNPTALKASKSVPTLAVAASVEGGSVAGSSSGSADAPPTRLAAKRSAAEGYAGGAPLAPYLDLMDLRGCLGLAPLAGSGPAKPLGIEGFKEPRPGLLRRLPPRVYAGVDKGAWQEAL